MGGSWEEDTQKQFLRNICHEMKWYLRQKLFLKFFKYPDLIWMNISISVKN